MRHLFIINPAATRVKGRVPDIIGEIKTFFRDMKTDNFDIHVTRWARDGMGFANRYALSSPEPARIHALGGSGTLYEVVNGVIGLPNVQVATYPLGGSNFCAHCFGRSREYMFRSLRNQVFSGVIPIDAMRYENIFSVGYVMVGVEAVADRDGAKLMGGKIKLPADVCSIIAALNAVVKCGSISRKFDVTIDGEDHGGEYISILIAGTPRYGVEMSPAPEALPNDGVMDIYLMKKMSPLKTLCIMNAYLRGRHAKLGGLVKHVRGKKISLFAQKDFVVSMDGEIFRERKISCEITPAAVDLVCPDGIDAKRRICAYDNMLGVGGGYEQR